MNNYCPTCDRETDQTYQNGMYQCSECRGGRSYLAASPPEERSFMYNCHNCGNVQFNWDKEWPWHKDDRDWSYYVCSGCGSTYNLPVSAKKRTEWQEWVEKGCPPPWWFRPLQLTVLATLGTLTWFFPWWMLVAYLVLCYGFMGYAYLSGELIPASPVAGVISWLLSPISFPMFIFLSAFAIL